MQTRFRVQSTAQVSDKKRFVILGQVLEGSLKVGMKVSVPLNNQLGLEAKVGALEILCREGACDSGISIDCESDEELKLWAALNIGEGEILLLTE